MITMTERQEILDFGMTFPDVYIDTPFRDDNWVLLRYRKNKRAFAWTYERKGHIWVNVKVDPMWRAVCDRSHRLPPPFVAGEER